MLYADQGKLGEAEKMYQRALEGYDKALGRDHTSTLNTVNNLGNLYKNQGKLGDAEKMYQRALEGREKALGRDHTSTLDTVNNLGNLYADQGKLGEAEKMYQRALDGYEKALGPELAAFYIPALNTVYNLGVLFARQHAVDKARAMYVRALAGFEKTFGDNHELCQNIREKLSSLHIPAEERNASEDSTSNYTPVGMSHSNAWPSTLVSRRRRLLQRLGLKSTGPA
jgi:tetratricopeptide (TPR) repeat protein